MKKLFSIFLAALVLISNMGFSFNTHFCGGEVVERSLSVGLQNPACCPSDSENSASSRDQVTRASCCEDQHYVLQTDDNITSVPASWSVHPLFLLAFTHHFIQPLLLPAQPATPYGFYQPPQPYKDIRVLFQTFLI